MAAEEPLDKTAQLVELGFDSMMSAQLRTRINEQFFIDAPATLLFDHPTIGELFAYVSAKVAARGRTRTLYFGGPPTEPVAPANGAPRSSGDDYASVEQDEVMETFFGRHVFLRGLVQFSLSIVLVLLVSLCFMPSFYFARVVIYDVDRLWLAQYFMDSSLILLPLSSWCFSLALQFVSVILKWLLIGRYKPGRYPIWGSFFFRWWFMDRLLRLVPYFSFSAFHYESPVGKVWYWCLGARISWVVHLKVDCCYYYFPCSLLFISKGVILEPDLVCMGRGSGTEALISCSILHPTYLELRPVTLEEGAWVGYNGVVYPGVVVPRNSLVDDMAFLERQWAVENVAYSGNPAKPTNKSFSPNNVQEKLPVELVRCVLRYVLQSYFLFSALVPTIVLFNYINYWYGAAWAFGSLVVLMPLIILVGSVVYIVLKWLILCASIPAPIRCTAFLRFAEASSTCVDTLSFASLLCFGTISHGSPGCSNCWRQRLDQQLVGHVFRPALHHHLGRGQGGLRLLYRPLSLPEDLAVRWRPPYHRASGDWRELLCGNTLRSAGWR